MIGVEPFAAKATAGGAECSAELRIAREAEEGGGEGGFVVEGDGVAGLVVADDFGRAVDGERDDRHAHEQCLHDGAGQAFPLGCVGEDVGGGEYFGDSLGGDESGEDGAFVQVAVAEFGFVVGALRAVADPEKADVGVLLGDAGHDGEQLFVAFALEEAGNGCDDDVFGLEAPGCAGLGALLGVGREARHIHAGVDGGEFVAWADACVDGLFDHGVGDGDDAVGASGGVAFEECVGALCPPGLGAVEAHAVDGVHDAGYAGVGGGEAAEDAGF